MHRYTVGLTPAIRAGKGWGRRELAPKCSTAQLAARRHAPGKTCRALIDSHTHTISTTRRQHRQFLPPEKATPPLVFAPRVDKTHPKTLSPRTTCIENHFHHPKQKTISPMTLSSKIGSISSTDTFIQARFHPMILSSKTLSSNFDTFIQ